MKLKNSVILNGKASEKDWRPVKYYLDQLQSEDNKLIERSVAEFVFKRINKVSHQRFFSLDPSQGTAEVRWTPFDKNNKPLLGTDENGNPEFSMITTAKLLSHPHEVYEARIHLKNPYNIVKRVVFEIDKYNEQYYKLYTDYCDKAKYSNQTAANNAVNDLAYECQNVIETTDFKNPTIVEYVEEGIYVND